MSEPDKRPRFHVLPPCLLESRLALGWLDTLAALASRPFTIGVGLASARLATIYPQPHDIPLDAIVTEAGIEGETP